MSSTAAASQSTQDSCCTVTPETLEQRLLADVYQWTAAVSAGGNSANFPGGNVSSGNSANFPGGSVLLSDNVRSADVDWQSALVWHTPEQPQLEVDQQLLFRFCCLWEN